MDQQSQDRIEHGVIRSVHNRSRTLFAGQEKPCFIKTFDGLPQSISCKSFAVGFLVQILMPSSVMAR